MTPYFIRIEFEQDLVWLQSILDNSIAKLKQGSTMLEAASEHIVRVHECVMNAVPGSEVVALGITNEFTKEEIKGKKKANQIKEERYKYNHCSSHPYLKMARVPSTDCEGCWEAYQRLHPEKYGVARRDFERKRQLKNA